jgi:hypothetical protein
VQRRASQYDGVDQSVSPKGIRRSQSVSRGNASGSARRVAVQPTSPSRPQTPGGRRPDDVRLLAGEMENLLRALPEEFRPAAHECWRLCRNAVDENSAENAPPLCRFDGLTC